jgi:hypothetical protein
MGVVAGDGAMRLVARGGAVGRLGARGGNGCGLEVFDAGSSAGDGRAEG